MAQETNKRTGDLLRDAIIAQGRDERSAMDALRKHLTDRERELLEAKLAAQSAWDKSPTEEAFNEEWFSPLDILDTADERLADDAEKWSIVQELQAGTIRAVARKAQANPHAFGAEHLVAIYPDAWRRMDKNAEYFFWKTRNLVVSSGRSDGYGHPTGDKERYFDIKFDPASFSSKPLPPPPPDGADPVFLAEVGVETILQSQEAERRVARAKLDPLSAMDAERFCRFLLDVRPNATERDAHRRAVDFFHDRRVPRDWFWDIFRSIRGDKKPGPPPKTRG